MQRRAGGLVELVCWWVVLTLGYLGLISSRPFVELVVAVAVGGACAVVAVAARRAFDPDVTPPPFVRRVVALPVDVVTDAVALTRLLVTGHALREGSAVLDEVPVPRQPASARPWAVLLTSAAPGSLAVDVERREEGDVMLRHRLTAPGRVTAGLEPR